MAALGEIAIGWILLNLAIFLALMLRRDRPELRRQLFEWLVRSETNGRVASRRHHTHI